jgi:hypothetical protein
MDRWIRTAALALLLALLLASGTAAATVPRMEMAAIEVVPAAPTDDAIMGDATDAAAYIIAYPSAPASAREEGDDTLSAADYITIYPAATGERAAASLAYGAAAEKTAEAFRPAIPILSLSRYYSLDVPAAGKTLWVDMAWEGDGDHALTVYHPGGLLGTFRDGSDGKEDRRVFLRFSREGGVATGAWTFKATAPLVGARENITFQTYLE